VRGRVLFKVLALLAAIVSLFMIWPLVWAFMDGSHDVKAFLVSIGCGLSVAGILFLLGRREFCASLPDAYGQAFGLVEG
jgi:trk system potassium uptake protein TrkH